MNRRHLLALPWAALLWGQGSVQIHFDGSAFRVTGWRGGSDASSLGDFFAVYAGSAPDAPPILGIYSSEGEAIVFKPRYPITPGVRIRAVFRAPGSQPVTAIFEPADRKTNPTTRVEQVYPSGDVLPSNLLRFYIQFSGPMRRGEAWQHIRLLDSHGRTLELPFLELDQELWDREGCRLTVLFDPGRIKRGVLPREELGGALVEGGKYTFVVDTDWKDANGLPLQSSFEKRFRVVPEARRGIDLSAWKIQPPPAATKTALVVDFPAPLDFALLHRLIEVHDARGRIDGSISVSRNETQWRLEPAAEWRPGAYQLRVDTGLEDVAGNRVGRPFDVDKFEKITTRIVPKTESLPFQIRLK